MFFTLIIPFAYVIGRRCFTIRRSMQTAIYQQFARRFPTDDVCLEHLLALRFGNPGACPKCGRRGRFHRLSKEPAYVCQWCGHHIHPMAATAFASTRVSLQIWYFLMFLICTRTKPFSAREIQREIGVTYKTAWRMKREIARHLADNDLSDAR